MTPLYLLILVTILYHWMSPLNFLQFEILKYFLLNIDNRNSNTINIAVYVSGMNKIPCYNMCDVNGDFPEYMASGQYSDGDSDGFHNIPLGTR